MAPLLKLFNNTSELAEAFQVKHWGFLGWKRP
jgi:hypothetical protein